jgi:effector-binding domain-containing protein
MTTYEVAVEELEPQPAAVVREHVDVAGLPEFLGTAFSDVMRALGAQGLAPAGPPFARYRPDADGFDVEAGFPTFERLVPAGRVDVELLPGGLTAIVLHRGAYDAVAAAYDAATSWLADNGYVPAGEPWESYLDDPEVAEPRTLVHMPCRPTGRADYEEATPP